MVLRYSNVSEPPWDRVYKALVNPKFNFRTVAGISRDTGLTFDDVQKILSQHADKIRIGNSTDKEGQLLYTIRDRRQSVREILSNVQTIITSTTSDT